MSFTEEANDIIAKLASKDEYIDRGYQAARASAILPTAIDRIEELEGYLCEAEARSLLNFQRYEALREAVDNGEMYEWKERPSWDGLPDIEKESRIELSRKMLHWEGKL